MKKIKPKYIFYILILFLTAINIVNAQSIGVTPEKTIEVIANTIASSYFGVSQGSEHAEKITIEYNEDWLYIKDIEFVLESKTRKTIKADINIKEEGTYTASIRVCGSEIASGGAVLSTKACTSHKLTVIAKEIKIEEPIKPIIQHDNKKPLVYVIISLIALSLAVYLLILKNIIKKSEKSVKPNKSKKIEKKIKSTVIRKSNKKKI